MAGLVNKPQKAAKALFVSRNRNARYNAYH